MDLPFLSLPEFHRVYFYRFVTFGFLALAGVLSVVKLSEMTPGERMVILPCLLLMCGRFAVEWIRLSRCAPASIHNAELIITSDGGHRQIPLKDIRSVTSNHSIFMVRRYRSWTDHLAFLQFTLSNGERVHTLVESAVFELPAGKKSLLAIRQAILEAKIKPA